MDKITEKRLEEALKYCSEDAVMFCVIANRKLRSGELTIEEVKAYGYTGNIPEEHTS